MIPRIEGTYYPDHRREMPARPLDPHGEPSLFTAQGVPLRQMIVMVDAMLLSNEASWSPNLVLSRLLAHPFIRCYRYAENGPPVNVPVVFRDSMEVPYGWVIAHQGEVHFWNGERIVRDNFWLDPNQEELMGDRGSDIKASSLAGKIGADIFVTERERLLSEKRWQTENSHYGGHEPPCYGVQDALALVGLYLRTQGDYSIYGLEPNKSFGYTAKQRFYWRGARALVPEIWGWLSQLDTKNHDSHIRDVSLLGISLAQRIEFALAERDAIHQALNQPDDFYAANEVFVRFDNCLFLLMGAFDACARVAHQVLATKIGPDQAGKRENSGWQNKRWRAKLESVLPSLPSLVDENSHGGRVLMILKELRNTVHAESLLSRGVQQIGNHGFYPLLALPQAKESLIREATEAVGGDWGIVTSRDETCADPGVFLERLFPHVTHLLNDLMAHTPLEEIPDVAPNSEASSYSAIMEATRWQLGFFEEGLAQASCRGTNAI